MFQLLFYFALVLGIAPILILKVAKKRQIVGTSIEPFLWLVFLSSLYEFFGTEILNLSTFWWFKLYLLLETLTLSYFFYKLLKYRFTIFLISFNVSFAAILLYHAVKPDYENGLKTDGYLTVCEIIFLYILSITYLLQSFNNEGEGLPVRNPNFIIIIGLLLYFAGTLFLYLTADYLLKGKSIDFLSYWNINIIFNIILRIFLIIAAWKIRRK